MLRLLWVQTFLFVVSCSNLAGSDKNKGDSPSETEQEPPEEENAPQPISEYEKAVAPTDVAGGMGLRAMECEAINSNDSTAKSAVLNCVILGSDGAKFPGKIEIESLTVTIKGQKDPVVGQVTILDKNHPYSISVEVVNVPPSAVEMAIFSGVLDGKREELLALIRTGNVRKTTDDISLFVDGAAEIKSESCELKAPCTSIKAALSLVPEHINHKVKIYVAAEVYKENLYIGGKTISDEGLLSIIGMPRPFPVDLQPGSKHESNRFELIPSDSSVAAGILIENITSGELPKLIIDGVNIVGFRQSIIGRNVSFAIGRAKLSVPPIPTTSEFCKSQDIASGINAISADTVRISNVEVHMASQGWCKVPIPGNMIGMRFNKVNLVEFRNDIKISGVQTGISLTKSTSAIDEAKIRISEVDAGILLTGGEMTSEVLATSISLISIDAKTMGMSAYNNSQAFLKSTDFMVNITAPHGFALLASGNSNFKFFASAAPVYSQNPPEEPQLDPNLFVPRKFHINLAPATYKSISGRMIRVSNGSTVDLRAVKNSAPKSFVDPIEYRLCSPDSESNSIYVIENSTLYFENPEAPSDVIPSDCPFAEGSPRVIRAVTDEGLGSSIVRLSFVDGQNSGEKKGVTCTNTDPVGCIIPAIP